jgi:hypothetical protein
MFSADSTNFDIIPVLWATFLCPTSSIQCRSACLTTSTSGFCTARRCKNGSTSMMQSGYPCLLTTTSHKNKVIWRIFSMEWKGDEGNQLVPAWSCNSDSTRRKPHSASHIQLHNWVQTGIVRSLHVWSILIPRWCNIALSRGRIASCTHVQRCFATQASQWQREGQTYCPDNRTREEAQGRRGNKCWNLDAVQEVVRNELLTAIHQP